MNAACVSEYDDGHHDPIRGTFKERLLCIVTHPQLLQCKVPPAKTKSHL